MSWLGIFTLSGGVELHDVQIDNPAGFPKQPLAKVNELDAQIALMPLLAGEAKIGKLVLKQLNLDLIRNSKGKDNWEMKTNNSNSSNTKKSDKPTTKPASDKLIDNMRNSLSMLDKHSIAAIDISDANISYKDQQSKQQYQVKHFNLQSNAIEPNSTFPLKLGFDFSQSNPSMTGSIKLDTDVMLDPEQVALSLDNMKLRAKSKEKKSAPLDIDLSGNLAANLSKGSITGKFAIPKFTYDKNVASNIQSTLQGSMDPNSKTIDELIASSKITLNTSVAKVKIDKAKLSNIKVTTTAQNNVINLNPITANLYSGTFKGDVRIDNRRVTPRYNINVNINNVQAGALLKDVMDDSKFKASGTANMQAKISTAGTDEKAMKRNLNGSGNFALKNGVLPGIDIFYYVDMAQALIKRVAAPTSPQTQQTPFGDLSGSYTIKNGVVTNNDLLLVSPRLRAVGKGQVDLVRERIDYKIIATEQNLKLPIPIKITGHLDNPRIQPDVSALVRENIQDRLQQLLGGDSEASPTTDDSQKSFPIDLKSIFR